MIDQELALRALKGVDFEGTTHIRSIWSDFPYDVDSLHAVARQTISRDLENLKASEDSISLLGRVLVGNGGTGKTHLLNTIRRDAFNRNIGFILADMTDVRDNFWDIVLKGYVNSLQKNLADGTPQFKGILDCLIAKTSSPVSTEKLAQSSEQNLNKEIKAILAALGRVARQETIRFQDVIRALLLLNSDDLRLQGIGLNWLQGSKIDQSEKDTFGFSKISADSLTIVEGISWSMSLKGPSVLALDQLDAVIARYRSVASIDGQAISLSEEQRAAIDLAKSIVVDLGNGLSALRDKTSRTLMIVTCIELTWSTLRKLALSTVKDRFHEEMSLSPVVKSEIVGQIIEYRLKLAYEKVGFHPPYPTYPFTPQFLVSATEQFPREILRRCAKHRDFCLEQEAVVELNRFALEQHPEPVNEDHPTKLQPTPDSTAIAALNPSQSKLDNALKQLEQEFEVAKSQVNLTSVLAESEESEKLLAAWLQTACYCLVKENEIADDIDPVIDPFPLETKMVPALHVRLSLVFRNENDRQKDLYLRALQRSHHHTYRSRLEAAMQASSIAKNINFRRLMVVRTQPIPGGSLSQQRTREFQEAGGLLASPIEFSRQPNPDDAKEHELLILGAVHQLQQAQADQPNSHFDRWLRDRRPISTLPFLQDVVAWLFDGALRPIPEPEAEPPILAQSSSSGSQWTLPGAAPSERLQPLVLPGKLPVGARLVGQQTREPITIRVEDLTKHTVVLAGSGSGKTVLVKRLVEEAALLGIPAIVIDGANDLARMGDCWESTPAGWTEIDRQKAEQYHQITQVVVWTPGREAANPLNLKPLPDFTAVANDPDELSQAIAMAHSSLQEIVAAGKGQTAKVKQAILKETLEYFAQNGGGTLEEFAELLSDCPAEAIGNYTKADKRTQEIADALNAEISINPLLKQNGSALDPAVLMGLNDMSGKTRISIINFIGLPGLGQQQQFLNQLAMTLFTWIKKNPAPSDRPLRGLLVIDEAKDFVPSGSTTACKASLIRLVAQARKYGLGIVFATQAPKSIDHNIIANCSTQFYGRANSPTSIQVMQEQLSQRGSSGQDIPKLQQGQFYVVSESLANPAKIATPLCLSYHAALDEIEVMQRAIASRNRINCH